MDLNKIASAKVVKSQMVSAKDGRKVESVTLQFSDASTGYLKVYPPKVATVSAKPTPSKKPAQVATMDPADLLAKLAELIAGK